MEEQLREGYKGATMGTFGGGLASEFHRVLGPIGTLAEEGCYRTAPGKDDERRLEPITELATRVLLSSIEWPLSAMEVCGKPKRSLRRRGA